MVRERLRFERSRLLQQGELSTPADGFALRLELLRRLEEAKAKVTSPRCAS
jgi:hypothetical protein